MSYWKYKGRINPLANGEQDQLPCPKPDNCDCVWTFRNDRWTKGDDKRGCEVHCR